MRPQVQEARVLAACALLLAAPAAHASFLSGDALDTAANWLAWFVIFLVPIVGIAVFLMVHVLPEKVAEKRHHPHKDSIKVLCILSLFFGGMLWPFAWLWAYTRPIGFKAIYGTEKHEDYFLEMGEKARAGELSAAEVASLRRELEVMASRTPLLAELERVLDDLKRLEANPPPEARERRAPEPAHGE